MKEKEIEIYMQDISKVFSQLERKNEVYDFLKTLLTENEQIEMSRRFQVAKMLNKGISYKKIEKATNMSSTTIAKISKQVNKIPSPYSKALYIVSKR